MNFKEFITLCEQPHTYSVEPLDIMLGGRLYQGVRGIDPRIEQWPDKELKNKFFLLHMRGKSLFFLDDKMQAYEINGKGIIKPANKAEPDQTMPNYWYNKAQFRIGDEVIDNMLDPPKINHKAIA